MKIIQTATTTETKPAKTCDIYIYLHIYIYICIYIYIFLAALPLNEGNEGSADICVANQLLPLALVNWGSGRLPLWHIASLC